MRGVAALGVFVYHAWLLWAIALSIRGVADPAKAIGFGDLGALNVAEFSVYIFFVLSGYFIARPFVHSFVEGRTPPGFGEYARRRVLRIVPAFWFVVAVIMVRHGTLDSSASELVAIFGFFQTFEHGGPEVNQVIGQAWTLHVEMGFYLLVPLATVLLISGSGSGRSRGARIRVVLGAALVMAIASLTLRHFAPQTDPWLRGIPALLFAFAPGVALAALESFAPKRLRHLRWSRPLALGLAAAAIAFLAIARLSDPVALVGLFTAAGAGALVAAPLVLQWSGHRAWRVLDNRLMHWVGARSYSFYLVHLVVLTELVPALDGIADPTAGFLVVLAAGGITSAAAAAFSYRFVELPFMSLRKRTRPKEPGPDPDVAPEPALVPEG